MKLSKEIDYVTKRMKNVASLVKRKARSYFFFSKGNIQVNI